MAHNQTRGYTRTDLERLYSPLSQHVKSVTEVLDGSNTEEIKLFADVCGKISIQASDTLVCDVEVSINGVDWVALATGVNKSAIVSYDTHNVSSLKITRTAGTGRLHILGAI